MNHLGWNVGLGCGLRFCISNKISGDAATADWGTTLRADSGRVETLLQAAGISGAFCLHRHAVLFPVTALTTSIISLIHKSEMHKCPCFLTLDTWGFSLSLCAPVSLTYFLFRSPPALALSHTSTGLSCHGVFWSLLKCLLREDAIWNSSPCPSSRPLSPLILLQASS